MAIKAVEHELAEVTTSDDHEQSPDDVVVSDDGNKDVASATRSESPKHRHDKSAIPKHVSTGRQQEQGSSRQRPRIQRDAGGDHEEKADAGSVRQSQREKALTCSVTPRTTPPATSSLALHTRTSPPQHQDLDATLVEGSVSPETAGTRDNKVLEQQHTGKAAMDSVDIILRCARFSNTTDDRLDISYYFRLTSATRLPKQDRLKMLAPKLLQYLLTVELQHRMFEEVREYLKQPVSWKAADGPRANSGRISGMFHSLMQQVIREDPLHYALMVAMQHDGEWKLRSYPLACEVFKRVDEQAQTGLFVRLHEDSFRPSSFLKVTWKLDEGSQPQFGRMSVYFNTYFLSQQDIKESLKMDDLKLQRMNQECLLPKESMAHDHEHPASLPLPHCSSIGAALAGSMSWESRSVQYELQELFNPDDGVAEQFVLRTRARILAAWKDTAMEFNRRARQLAQGHQK